MIVRTKDRPFFLRRALKDIAAQTLTELVVFVVNDGGDRANVDAAVQQSQLSDRVNVIDASTPGGRSAAANAAIRRAQEPYVVLHDDDDFWHPEFLERTATFLDNHPSLAGVMVPTEIVYEEPDGDGWAESGRVPFWPGLQAITFTSLLEVNRAVPISFLYRLSVHDAVGLYSEWLSTVEDWEFYLRLTAQFPVGFLAGEPLAFWTQRPAAHGSAGNSMFELGAQHLLDDSAVRDAALRSWVRDNGPGLPLFLALQEKRLHASLAQHFERERVAIADAILERHPIWGRLRRVRRRLRGR